MKQFNELNEIYEHLESEAINYKYNTEITSLFKYTGELKFKDGNTDDATKAQWEMDFLNFVLHENTIKGFASGTDKDGVFFEIPSLSDFTEDKYQYLIQRQRETRNPLFKARYSHILWLSPKKHIDYSKEAIIAYLELVKIYEKKDLENDDRISRSGLEVLNSIKNAYHLAVSIKDKLDEVKSEVLRLMKDFNFKSSSSYVMRIRLVNTMLENKKLFDRADFVGLEKICESMANERRESDPHMSIDLLEVAEKIDNKLGNRNAKWQKEIAVIYEEMSINREDKTNLASMSFCEKAIEIYKKLKENEKVQELEKRYKHLKDTMQLGQIGHEVDLTEMMQEFRRSADNLSERDSDVIIQTLMLDSKLLPNEDELKEQVKEQRKSNFLQFTATIEIFDHAGNVAQYFSDADEHEYYALLQNYDFSLKFSRHHFIREIFFAGIKKGKLSATQMLDFFSKYSWFGKNLQKPNGEVHNWLSLIAPSLIEYFKQMEMAFSKEGYYPNLVLPIDSLTVKIEGLLRDLCELHAVTTFCFTKDKKGRTVSREKDIHALLYEDAITKLLDKDDLLFLRFLLVEKAGFNLRHKVAHSLMPFNEYSLEYIHLLILAIIRLGKYDFQETGQEVQSEAL